MPNGSDLTPEEFESLERPLLRVDSTIVEFARQKKTRIIRNYHNRPDRHIDWSDSSGITKAILISPVLKYHGEIGNVQRWIEYAVTVVAHKDYPEVDRPNSAHHTRPRLNRKWWHKKIAEFDALPKDGHDFNQLLEAAYAELERIEERHLLPV